MRAPGWGLLILFTVLTRLPALLHPRGIDDEPVYAVVASEIVAGGLPYRDAIERKPPLLFWTYAAVFRLAGPYHWPALHLVAVGWTLLTMAGLFYAARERFGRDAGLAAAFLYALFTPWFSFKNLAFNGELMMNLPIAWALWLALRRDGTGRAMAVIGGLGAVAFLLKQPAGIATAAFGLAILTPGYRARHGLGWWGVIARGTWLTLGFAVVMAAAALVLARQGILAEAWYWTVGDHARVYSPLSAVFWQRAAMTIPFLLICAPLILGAVIAARAGWRPGGALWPERDAVVILLLLTGLSCVGVAAGGRFYPHYYLQLFVPLAVLAAPAVAAALAGTPLAAAPLFRPAPLRRWLAATAVVFLGINTVQLAGRRAPSPAAEYVRRETGAGERIFVWGQAAHLYAESDRRPASRYIATFPLTGYVFGNPRSWDPSFDTSDRILPGAWDNLERDFADHPPALILDTDAARAVPRYPMRSFPQLRRILDAGYVEVARTPDAVIYRRTAVRPSRSATAPGSSTGPG
jgi:4-amino-4-deoxy-L-arabinose transferase-like glycosyltransferase